MSGRAVGHIAEGDFSRWVLRDFKQSVFGEFDIYWKRNVVFRAVLKTTSFENEGEKTFTFSPPLS